MIGIVVVSHSRALADAVVTLANDMVDSDKRPHIEVAAGLDATTFGTDAAAISDALAAADSPDGVLVFMDLGSAILSTQMALEFVDPDLAARVRLSPAPLVEGLLAAVVTAAGGASLAAVDAEACQGLVPKQMQLAPDEPDDQPAPAGSSTTSEAPATPEAGSKPLEFVHTLTNPHGLHARPAAALAGALNGLDAEVKVSNRSNGRGPVPGTSVVQLATLALRQGDELEVQATGPQAAEAIQRLHDLADQNFGDTDEEPAAPAATATLTEAVTAPAFALPVRPDTGSYIPGNIDAESNRFSAAVDAVDSYLGGLTAQPPAAVADALPAILEAQRTILHDRSLTKKILKDTSGGLPAVDAVIARFDKQAGRFDSLADPYLRERAQDIRSLERMVLLALLDQPLGATPPETPYIATGVELDAATAALLVPGTALAVATSGPGDQGHGAILARKLGVAFLAGVEGADSVSEGQQVTLTPEGTLTDA